MQFNITFKTIFEYVLKKLVLCIQIRFVSTEKTTRIASRASCFIFGLLLFSSFVFSGPNHFFFVEIVKCSLECLTDVSIMFSQRSTSLKKT